MNKLQKEIITYSVAGTIMLIIGITLLSINCDFKATWSAILNNSRLDWATISLKEKWNLALPYIGLLCLIVAALNLIIAVLDTIDYIKTQRKKDLK